MSPLRRLPGGDRLAALAVALLAFAVFLASPNRHMTDSHFTLLLSRSLLRHGSFALDRSFVRPLDPAKYPRLRPNGYPSQVRESRGHLYYFFPAGSSVLSVPFVAVMGAFGLSPVRPDGGYDRESEERMQGILAALLMAALATVLHATARLYVPPAHAFVVTLVACFGTQMWSTASRVLWSATWQMLLVGVVTWILAAHETRARRIPPVLLATILSWAYFVRPTSAPFIVAVGLYVLAYHRPLFARYAVAGLLWLAAFAAHSLALHGRPLPDYYAAGRLSLEGFWTHVAGNLVSPSRGLLVFTPVLAIVAFWIARHRRRLPTPRLVWPAALAVATHLAVVSSFPDWVGGHSYGPRLTAELVPWFFLLAVVGLGAALASMSQSGGQARAGLRRQLAVATALAAWGVFTHGRGALAGETWRWNVESEPEESLARRVWDWSNPQFLAGLVEAPEPAAPRAYPRYALGTRIRAAAAAAEAYLPRGWGRPAAEGRWTTGREAAFAFSLEAPRPAAPATLTMRLVAYLADGRLERQRVCLELNGAPLADLVLGTPDPTVVSVPVPESSLREQNLLVFRFPDARAPVTLGAGRRRQPRAVALEWLELHPSDAGE